MYTSKIKKKVNHIIGSTVLLNILLLVLLLYYYLLVREKVSSLQPLWALMILSFILLNRICVAHYGKEQAVKQLKKRVEETEEKLILNQIQVMEIVDEKTEKIMLQKKRLEELNASILDSLADIVEFRDLESGQHIKRVKKYVYLLMTKITELYPEYRQYQPVIHKVCDASALHDIGKIGISDLILLKPAKLTVHEFEEVKKHTTIGGSIVSGILDKYDDEMMKICYEVCMYHHERYDGKGYPEGLKGEEIPLSAQVVGIADAYDALIERRIYKEAYSHEAAVKMILNGECGVFSDKIIHCFQLLESEFEKINNTEM